MNSKVDYFNFEALGGHHQVSDSINYSLKDLKSRTLEQKENSLQRVAYRKSSDFQSHARKDSQNNLTQSLQSNEFGAQHQSEYIVVNGDNDHLSHDNGVKQSLQLKESQESISRSKLERKNSHKSQRHGSDFDFQELSIPREKIQSFDENDQLKDNKSENSLFQDQEVQKDDSLVNINNQGKTILLHSRNNELDIDDSSQLISQIDVQSQKSSYDGNLQSSISGSFSPYIHLSQIDYSRLPKVASKYDKIHMYQLVKRGNLFPQDRRYIWLFSTGALGAMASCHRSQSYYNILKYHDKTFPNPNLKQISVDLPRTFQDEEYYQNPRTMKAVENVLKAYSIRNPTIGYCQGFNFIVGRLLKVVNEEEAFWMFCQIIETMMPLDYYSNMVGALIDQKVFTKIFQQIFPELNDHLSSLGCDASLITFQWFACFFSYNVPFHILERIWDLFFLKGCKILFRISLAIIHMIKNDLMQTTDFQQIFKTMENFPQKLQSSETLFQLANMRRYKISNQRINYERAELRYQVIDEIQGYSQELTQSINQKITRVKFLNKFYLYTGISKQMDQSKNFDITKSECIEHLKCNKNWPVCLFDFTYKNKVPEYFAYRVDHSSYTIDENHFYGSQAQSPESSQSLNLKFFNNDTKRSILIDQIKEESDNEIVSPPNYKQGPPQNNFSGIQIVSQLEDEFSECDLLVERNSHFCSHQSVQRFKRLLRCNDMNMYASDNLNFTITNEPESIEKIQQFVKQINDIEENNDKIQGLIKCLKRSNSEYLKGRPFTRMRTQSNDEDDKNLQLSRVQSRTPYPLKDIRSRTKSGKLEERRFNINRISIQQFKGDNGNLQTCTLACLFKGHNKKQLEMYIKDIKMRGFDIFSSFLQDFQDDKANKDYSLSPTKQQD